MKRFEYLLLVGFALTASATAQHPVTPVAVAKISLITAAAAVHLGWRARLGPRRLRESARLEAVGGAVAILAGADLLGLPFGAVVSVLCLYAAAVMLSALSRLIDQPRAVAGAAERLVGVDGIRTAAVRTLPPALPKPPFYGDAEVAPDQRRAGSRS